jgi:hypothetical protein
VELNLKQNRHLAAAIKNTLVARPGSRKYNEGPPGIKKSSHLSVFKSKFGRDPKLVDHDHPATDPGT